MPINKFVSLSADLKAVESRYVPDDRSHDTVLDTQSRTPLTDFFKQLHKGLTHKHCLHTHAFLAWKYSTTAGKFNHDIQTRFLFIPNIFIHTIHMLRWNYFAALTEISISSSAEFVLFLTVLSRVRAPVCVKWLWESWTKYTQKKIYI